MMDLSKEDLSILCVLRHQPPKTVYFYHDEKVYQEENERFIQMMRYFGLEWKVKKLHYWQVDPSSWEENGLFIIPGGHTTHIQERLGCKAEKIKRYAEELGGTLLLQCGGSYWAGEREYRFSADKILTRYSSLDLWKGKIVGPRCPNPKSSEEGQSSYVPEAVEIFWDTIDTPGHLLLTGGGTFVPAQDAPPYYPLARYSNGELAVVGLDVGAGQAILSMPYVTYPAAWSSSVVEHFKVKYPLVNVAKMQREIINSEKFRIKCCLRLFKSICKL